MMNQRKIDTIYLDMDGVLSDFMSKYRELNGDWKRDGEGKKSDGWSKFCEGGHFASLDPWPDGDILMAYVDALAISIPELRIEILTSTGGADYHEQVKADKIAWCCAQGIPYTVNAVPGRWTKKDWARPTAILIDDTQDVIDDWTAAGGIGILHVDVTETAKALAKALDIV
jgi:hypothetical protein